jgi:phospholipase D1/2
LVNPNHRHDEEHEKETDAKREDIGQSHRFHSFAPERPGNNIKWYVDGRDYCWVSLEPSIEIQEQS